MNTMNYFEQIYLYIRADWIDFQQKPNHTKEHAVYIRESSNHSLTFTKAKNKWNIYTFSVSWFCIYVISTTIYYNLLIFIVHLVLCLKGLLWKQCFNILLKEAGSKKDFHLMEIMNIKQEEINDNNSEKCYDWIDKSSTSCTKKRPSLLCMWTNDL